MLDDQLTQIISDVIGVDDLHLDESTVAADVPGWDSLAHINIMMSVEDAYGVVFTTEQLGRFRDLGELQDFLRAAAAK